MKSYFIKFILALALALPVGVIGTTNSAEAGSNYSNSKHSGETYRKKKLRKKRLLASKRKLQRARAAKRHVQRRQAKTHKHIVRANTQRRIIRKRVVVQNRATSRASSTRVVRVIRSQGQVRGSVRVQSHSSGGGHIGSGINHGSGVRLGLKGHNRGSATSYAHYHRDAHGHKIICNIVHSLY